MRFGTALFFGGLIVACVPVCVHAQAPPIGVWGALELRGYFTGERMAPNQRPYDPLFSLNVDLNIGRTDLAYLFVDSVFWGQKSTAGVTNEHSTFDFSKREFDILGGLAVRPLAQWDMPRWELRGFLYSLNNLNRGTDREKPSGFQDGGAIGGRYYWGRNYVGAGYYPGGTLVGQAGERFSPGLYGELGATYDFWRKPEQAALFLESQLIAEAPATGKLVNLNAGGLVRPFRRFLNLDLRLGIESVYDFQASRGRVLPYAGVAIAW